MSRTQNPDLKTIEPYDVSFAKLQPDGNWAETVLKVATAINVQFTESSEQLPFVSTRQFEKLLKEEKVFLFGPSGSGKSRTIIELIRNKKTRYDRIFVINPSNPAGLDSGRENIAVLSQQFGRKDLVIWDNFPEGLVKRDLENAFGALEIVNASAVQNLYIALKPTYLEMYRGLTIGIPDIYTQEITCDLETMKSLIKAYGKIEPYRDIFEKCVSANTDRIARILWQKQPLSLTVVDFYKALADRAASQVNEPAALDMAQSWLPVSDYFDRQFEVMKNLPARRHDVDFLYVLALCYEAGFDRTHASITRLQKSIFGTEPPAEPTHELGTWVYLSGQNYAMHDSAKNAIRLTDYSRMKIITYLTKNFTDIVPKGAGELHSLGLFIGRNIQFASENIAERREKEAPPRPVPSKVYAFMRNSAVLARALGQGIGENFELLDDALQQSILLLVDSELEFGVGLADVLGERFVELDDYNRNRVFEKIYQGMLFARYFGQSVGRRYGRLSDEFRSFVLSHTEKNPQFADGLGMGLGYTYMALDPAMQNEIMNKAKGSYEITRGLGFGFGLTFGLLPDEEREKLLAELDSNSELDAGFGMGMGASYASLQEKQRTFVLDRIARDCEFAFGTGIYAAFTYRESCPSEIFKLVHTNTEVAFGIGLGYGTMFFYLPARFQLELEYLLKGNFKLDEGFGSGIGLVLKHLPATLQDSFFDRASTNNSFAIGLAYGLGYTWQYIGPDLRKKAIEIAGSNNEFARGLGIGLGSHLDYLKSVYLDEVVSIADTNSEFDRGFGAGASWAWPYYSDHARSIATERIDTKSEFAAGFAFGLTRVVKHFPASEKERLFSRISWDPFFSEGFGEGTGNYLWSVYDRQSKTDFLEKAAGSAEIARGLGAGIGTLYNFFKEEVHKELSSNPRFKGKDIRKGFGIGMGRAYRYLSDDSRTYALGMAEQDVEFAVGFGQGIGTVYNYLEDAQREMILSHLGDTGFSRGLGFGFGLVLPYFSDELKKQILGYAAHNKQLSLGLGSALASRISYLSEPVAFSVFELAKSNPYLAAGLGEGCGSTFFKLSKSTKDKLAPWINIDGFSFGFGIGVGKARKYLGNNTFEQAAAFVKGSEFVEGFAIGMGSSAANIPKALLHEAWSRYPNEKFARNFGFGLGHAISTLDDGKRNEIFEIGRDNAQFLTGIGEGVGHSLPITGSRVVEQAMQALDSLDFAKGAASGVSEVFKHLGLAEAHGMIEYAGSRPEYGSVLGRGLAEKFASFDQDMQSLILDALQKDTDFSKEFAKIIPRNLVYTSAQSQERIKRLLTELPHLRSVHEGAS
jgi:hypothetical protein